MRGTQGNRPKKRRRADEFRFFFIGGSQMRHSIYLPLLPASPSFTRPRSSAREGGGIGHGHNNSKESVRGRSGGGRWKTDGRSLLGCVHCVRCLPSKRLLIGDVQFILPYSGSDHFDLHLLLLLRDLVLLQAIHNERGFTSPDSPQYNDLELALKRSHQLVDG